MSRDEMLAKLAGLPEADRQRALAGTLPLIFDGTSNAEALEELLTTAYHGVGRTWVRVSVDGPDHVIIADTREDGLVGAVTWTGDEWTVTEPPDEEYEALAFIGGAL